MSELTDSRPPLTTAGTADLPALRQISRGQWEVETDIVGRDFGHLVRFAPGGEPHVKQELLAAAELMAQVTQVDETGIAEIDRAAHNAKPMTVLAAMTSPYGSTSIQALEGRPVRTEDDGLAILAKGSKTEGYQLGAGVRIMSVAQGYGAQEGLAAHYRRIRSWVPSTTPATFDDIPDEDDGLDEGSSPMVRAAFLLSGPDLGPGPVPGCVFFATEMTGDDIVNGYFWAPADNMLTPESGSMYTADLLQRSGRAKNFVPNSITFEQLVMEQVSTDRSAMYQLIDPSTA